MLLLRTIDSYANTQMLAVLLDEILHFLRMIINTICRETKPVGIKPMMVSAEHLCLQIITDFINQIYFQKWFSTDKVPHHGLFTKVLFMVKNIVNRLLGNLPGHTLFRILPYEIAILTGKLTILGDDEGDILRTSA